MNNLKMLLNKTGEPATLELLAEESAELAHAALKLARVLRGENPTPLTSGEATVKLHAEIADILSVIMVLMQADWFDSEFVDQGTDGKIKRWQTRMRLNHD